MRDLWRPTAVAAVLLTPFLVLGACKAGSNPKPVPEPQEGSTTPGFTHDGAVAIAVITSFEDARRAVLNTDPDVAAGATCTFLTEQAQERLVEEARAEDLIGDKSECVDAMLVLVEKRNVPGKATSVSVVRAEDEVTEVVVVRGDGSAETYTLVGERKENSWLIDDITAADEPVIVSDPAPEEPAVKNPTAEDIIEDRKDAQRSGTPEYEYETGEDAPAAPSVTELPAEG